MARNTASRNALGVLTSALLSTSLALAQDSTPLPAAEPSASVAPTATIEPADVPAKGRHVAIARVGTFGRHAFLVQSPQGTALQLVDRMAGPGPLTGQAGERDGRVDAFLDRGEYQLVALSRNEGSGSVKLSAHSFTELNATPLPVLPDLKLVSGALDDFQQRSWWVVLDERRVVAVEAAGRNLADLRLWRDGTWLVDAEPTCEVAQPKEGRPLFVCRIASGLEPGAYLVSAYGGPSQPWADEDGSHPLHLRMALPRLPEAGRERFTVSPFGVDRFLIPASANHVRIEVPEARPLLARMDMLDENAPFAPGSMKLEIRKDSVPPVAATTLSSEEGWRVVSVEGAEGQPFILQSFKALPSYPIPEAGSYWLATLNSGHPDDSLNDTAFLVNNASVTTGGHVEPEEAVAVQLDSTHSWARRFNLLVTSTLFLRVAEAGEYEVSLEGAKARCRIEPFLLQPPPSYEAPDFQGDGSKWALDRGFHVITFEPQKKGIVEAAISKAGLLDKVKSLVGAGPSENVDSGAGQARFGVRALDGRYTVYVNRIGEMTTGLLLRRAPLDLSDALPLTLKEGESLDIPFESGVTAILHARNEDGTLLEISLDGSQWLTAQRAEPGTHSVSVRWNGEGTASLSLRALPASIDPEAPLTPAPDTLSAPPVLPVLAEGTPQHVDLTPGYSSTFALRADAPGLFRIESTGLLATEGRLRMRTQPNLSSSSEGGTGRNFLLQQYLREGDYQVTVSPQGASAGHAGLILSRTRIGKRGELRPGVRARTTLRAGEMIVWQFRIEKAGEWRIASVGLGRRFTCRLEDEAGWPLERPGGDADITRHFEPGVYRYILLPGATDARAVTLLESLAPKLPEEGHGPFRLEFDEAASHVWLEPAKGAERVPDRYDFAMPAEADVTLSLSNEMKGELWAMHDGAQSRAGSVPPGGSREFHLAEGHYRLDVTCSRRNNRQAYTLSASPKPLVAGSSAAVTAPARVDVAVGAAGRLTLSSWGTDDVRARLIDSGGHVVAASDDAPDDWNFRIAARLVPGLYVLAIDPVGKSSASTRVTATAASPDEGEPATLPLDRTLTATTAGTLLPLAIPVGPDTLVLSASCSAALDLELEWLREGHWTSAGSASGQHPTLVAPILRDSSGAALPHRLLALAQDSSETIARISAIALNATRVTEARWREGVKLVEIPDIPAKLGVAVVTLERPGLFRLREGEAALVSDAPGRACLPATRGVTLARQELVVARDLSKGSTTRGTRLILGSGDERSVTVSLRQGELLSCDVTDSTTGAPLLVMASSMTGQPGIAFGGSGVEPAQAQDATRCAAWPRHALAFASEAARHGAVAWIADGSDVMDIRIELPKLVTGSGREWTGSLSPGESRRLQGEHLNAESRLRLLLGAGVVAALSDGSTITSVHSAGPASALDEIVDAQPKELLLANIGSAPAPFALAVLPSDGVPLEIGRDTPLETMKLNAGSLRARVSLPPSRAAAPTALHVLGEGAGITLLGTDGTIGAGRDVVLPAAGGIALLRHGIGALVAWCDDSLDARAPPWTGAAPSQELAMTLPGASALQGSALSLGFHVAEASLVTLRTTTPVVVHLMSSSGTVRNEAFPRGAALVAYLPSGDAQAWLRPFGASTLSGTATLTTSAAVPVGEGIGPEVLLGAGDARAFRFHVARPSTLGIGVKADSDIVDARLLDAAGLELARGVVQMVDVSEGDHVLLVQAPPDAVPVLVHVIVLGLSPPGLGPPPEVVRDFVEGGDTSAPASLGTLAPGRNGSQVSRHGEGGDDVGYEEEGGD